MHKKIMNLIVMSLFLAGMVAAQLDVDVGGVADIDAENAIDVGAQEIDVDSDVAARARAAASLRACVDLLQDSYPDVRPARLENKCIEIRARAMTMTNSETDKQIIRERINERDYANIAALNDARRNMVAHLKSGRLRKLNRLDQQSLEKLTDNVDNATLLRLTSLHDDVLDKIAQLEARQIAKLRALGRARIKEISQKDISEIRAELDSIYVKTVMREKAFQKREISRERYMEARQKYEEAKERYREQRRQYQQNRDSFREAVQAGDDDGAVEHARSMLMRAADMVIDSLEKIKARIESNDDLSEEEAAELTAEMDAHIETMLQAKSEVEAAQTKAEVKEAGSAIIEAWTRMKSRVKLNAGRVIKANVQDVLMRAQQLEARMDEALVRLEEQGYDTSEIDAKIDEFSADIEAARQKFREAKDRFDEARALDDESSREEIMALAEEGKGLVREAHDLLREAHSVFVDIVSSVRAQVGSADVITISDAQATVVIEEE